MAGQTYKIMAKNKAKKQWEVIDYADTRDEAEYMVDDYQNSYGDDWSIKYSK